MGLLINKSIEGASLPVSSVYIRLVQTNRSDGSIEVGKECYSSEEAFDNKSATINGVLPVSITKQGFYKVEADNAKGLKEAHDLVKAELLNDNKWLKAGDIKITL